MFETHFQSVSKVYAIDSATTQQNTVNQQNRVSQDYYGQTTTAYATYQPSGSAAARRRNLK